MQHRLIRIITLIAVCYSFSPANAQAPWSHIYDFCQNGTFKYKSQNVAQYADDSFFIAAGYTYDTNKFAPYIARFDYNGALLNSNILHFSDQRHQFAPNYPLLKTGADKYLIVGLEFDWKTKDSLEIRQPFFYFFNKAGDSLAFIKDKDSLVARTPFSAMQDAQKNIIVSGIISSRKILFSYWNGIYYYDSFYNWVAKYDSNANLIWSKKYDGIKGGYVWSDKVVLGQDKSSYIIGGIAPNPSKNYAETFISKIDTAGNVLWRTFLPRPFGTANDIDIVALSDGNYAFISSYSDAAPIPSVGISPPFIFYGKIDEQGNILWTKYFRKAYGWSQGRYITEAANGDLLLMAYVYFAGGKDRVTLIRTNGDGDIRWYRDYYHVDTTYMYHTGANMSLLRNRQILLSGSFRCEDTVENVFDTVGMFSWFVLSDTFGCQLPGCQQEDTMWHTTVQDINAITTDITIYPNPAQQVLNIKSGTSIPCAGSLQAYLCDISGRRLHASTLKYNSTETIDISQLPPGIYLLEVWENGQRVKRMKVEHY